MKSIQVVIVRRSNEENTVAVVQCESDTLTRPSDFRDALKRAVTAWARQQEVEPDYNIGDVDADVDEMRAYLEAEGIHNLNVESFTDTEPCGWDYDDCLITD